MTEFPKPSKAERTKAERLLRERQYIERGNLRHDCLVRAKYLCENRSCRANLASRGMAWDHWLGGGGRRTQLESKATTWVLCYGCNEKRTLNAPTAHYWNERFKEHCEKHGYEFTPHITRFEALKGDK